MEFGRTSALEGIDFSFPPDTDLTLQTLSKSSGAKPIIYIGCAKWGRADWIGKLYPKGTKAAGFLTEYARHFNCVEMNATHYSNFPEKTVLSWDEQTADDFKFFPKFHQSITHWKRLKDADAETERFFESLQPIDHKIEGYFLQVHESFGPKDSEVILRYFSNLKERHKVFLEVRHKAFFERNPTNELFFQQLSEMGVGLVITDAAGRRDCCHMNLTTPKAFIRFVGNSLHRSDYQRIDLWVERLKMWLDNGLEALYFFMHQHEELYSPELSAYLIEQLNKKCDLQVKPLQLLSTPTLF